MGPKLTSFHGFTDQLGVPNFSSFLIHSRTSINSPGRSLREVSACKKKTAPKQRPEKRRFSQIGDESLKPFRELCYNLLFGESKDLEYSNAFSTVLAITPAKLTWHLEITHLKRKIIFQTSKFLGSMLIVLRVAHAISKYFVHWALPSESRSKLSIRMVSCHRPKETNVKCWPCMIQL